MLFPVNFSTFLHRDTQFLPFSMLFPDNFSVFLHRDEQILPFPMLFPGNFSTFLHRDGALCFIPMLFPANFSAFLHRNKPDDSFPMLSPFFKISNVEITPAQIVIFFGDFASLANMNNQITQNFCFEHKKKKELKKSCFVKFSAAGFSTQN